MRKLYIPLLAGLLACTQSPLAAQCRFTPADCPVSEDYGSADDSVSRMGNPVLPREITMENRLRQWSAGVIGRLAEREHWSYVQLSEDFSSGARAADGSVLSYALRPPHWMIIRYQVVISEDSLKAWKSWLETFAQRRLDATMRYARQEVSHDAAVKADAAFEKERRQQTIHFREASLLVVEFEFNMDYVATAGAVAGGGSGAPIWYNNPDPEFNSIDLFARCHSNAILLVGDWGKTGEGFRPVWKGDKKNTDLVTTKRILCDQVRSISFHLSGNVGAMRKCLAGLPAQEINGLIAR